MAVFKAASKLAAAQSRNNRLCTDIKGSAGALPGLQKASRFKSCEQLLKLIKYKKASGNYFCRINF